MMRQQVLDELWDFSDPLGSEQRFRRYLTESQLSASERAEIETQLARSLGLQGRFDEARDLLGGVQSDQAVVQVRLALETGRVTNSAGIPADSVPSFEVAAALAAEHGLDFLRVDALHMLAIVQPADAARWTQQGLAVIAAARGGTEDLARLARWRVSLLNNLGWSLHDAAKHTAALEAFNQALAAAEEVGSPQQLFNARWAVARQLRELGQNEEAQEIQQSLAAQDPHASYVQEELQELAKIFDR
ncbi:tetratricopeptide repeat protein [Psychromicrobium lacuslunae]|uniref:tetratricopeptide repeat protein n=1 Tax=Psychromicrobium lacuslunae TaxID=1618207 RepID=UPI0006987A05|nr:tetratricopeptide repeat protein [Psychromicrobium lacuslunae]